MRAAQCAGLAQKGRILRAQTSHATNVGILRSEDGFYVRLYRRGETARISRTSVELRGARHDLQRRLRDLEILLARARADADRADDATVDDDRQSAGKIDAFTLGRDGQL